MDRTLVIETIKKVGEKVKLSGWVHTKRDHGKITFIDLRDRSGVLQIVGIDGLLCDIKPEYVVEIEGLVKKRPEKLINVKLATGTVEVEATKLTVLSEAEELPFDMGKSTLDLQLPTLLDYRTLTLRHEKERAIFKVQQELFNGFMKAGKDLDCTHIFAPTISASATEGGSELFTFDYFGSEAFMVQSPQLYKQMMVGVFERVFLFSHIYRAEPSVTTRHLVESIQMDFEIGFIDSFDEILGYLEQAFATIIDYAQNECKKELTLFGVKPSKVKNKIPRVTMREAQKIILERTGVDHTKEPDLMPEDERELASWALEKYDSDLVTVTHFPTKKRAFYSKPDPNDPEYCLSYDLIYKGLEISSGAQRVDNLEELKKIITDRGMKLERFKMYLQAFEYGMPPHGGFSYGLERSTMKLLDLENIRQASLFPRDMERVDFRLSTKGKKVSDTKR